MAAETSHRSALSVASGARAQRSALWIGDASPREFAPAETWLRQQSTLLTASSIPAACAILSPIDSSPLAIGWIVLATERPGQWAQEEIARLRSAAPFARVVMLLGPWCEGELAKRTPPAGVQRVAWHQFTSRFAAWTRRGTTEGPAAWPLTAAEEEKLGRSLRIDAAHRKSRTVRIIAGQRETRMALGEVLAALGHTQLDDTTHATAADVILWHVPSNSAAAVKEAASLRSLANGCPILALVDFLRPQDEAPLRQAGATNVIGRPFALHDLAVAIEAC